MADPESPLDRVVGAIRGSAKYRHVCEELIRNLGARELAKGRSFKEAVRATRTALHQAAGAYIDQGPNYRAALNELQVAAAEGGEGWREACARQMRFHASTRERLRILDQFYATILADHAPIRSVLDVACGLNPLAIPWMRLADEVEYYACDIYADLVGFLNEFVALARLKGGAEIADVTQDCPTRHAEVAFLLKSLPCLEQIDPTIGLRLLDTLNADHILVSFPVHSLGGKQKGMVPHYDARFQELVSQRPWKVTRFQFATELVFRVSK
jgi:16S rRNA (guanine(1405)-N(7))-methyltransferase